MLAAVALAAERLGREPRQSTVEAQLRRRLTSMAKTLQNCLDEFARVSSPDGLGWRIAALRQKLVLLDNERLSLEQRLTEVVPRRRRAPKAETRNP